MYRLVILLFLLHQVGFAQIKGKVVAIADGDTFTMLIDRNQIRVRLHGIDCPEKNQDFGAVARKCLSNLIFEKEVTVIDKGNDRYGRTIGMVIIDSVNVNERLLKEGLAWHYKRYDKNSIWSEYEDLARKDKKGLWSQPNPVPPWEYRKIK